MERIQIHTNELLQCAKTLRAGDQILLSGTIYTARDAAHKRICEQLDRGEEPPFPLKGATVYYAGPTRMDVFAPRLLDLGMICMIGKGNRAPAVVDAIRRNGAVYLCAIGGAGALAAKCVRNLKVLAYEDLGCESVKELQIEQFPLFVTIDCVGGSLFVD